MTDRDSLGTQQPFNGAPQSSRGRERYARIIEAARRLFLRDGFDATSIDSILEISGGSKATLYNYFPTKEDLFRAVIDSVVSNRDVPELHSSGSIRETLETFARTRLAVLFSEEHRALMRIIIAERQKFPDVARTYFEHGPKRSRVALTGYLAQLREEGRVAIDDADEAAEFLIGMLIHRHYFDCLVLGSEPPSETEAVRLADRVIGRFLAAYRQTAESS